MSTTEPDFGTDVTIVPTTCPRCGEDRSKEEYYGPCESCRIELRAKFAGEARDVEAAEYEPNMNVTPNAVASKD